MLSGALSVLLWFQLVNERPAVELAQAAADTIDSRPARKILFIGNSRTYGNDMPYMVRKIAASAGAPEKYQVTMHALPGRSFEDHWHNRRVNSLLAARGWNDVILQEKSGAHYEEASRLSFLVYGQRLVAKAVASGAKPTLLVSWPYGEEIFRTMPGNRQEHHEAIQSDFAVLARTTGASVANVGGVWQDVAAADPGFPLYRDGNHPTVQGSYLAALVLYAHVSGGDLSAVSYVPDGMTQDEADFLKRQVQQSTRSRLALGL